MPTFLLVKDAYVPWPWSYYRKVGYRQVPRLNLPLDYSGVKGRSTNQISSNLNPWKDTYGLLNASEVQRCLHNFAVNGDPLGFFNHDQLYTLAYEKFVSKAKVAAAELSTSLAERKEAYALMVNRMIRILNAARAARQLDISGFCKTLGITPNQRRSTGWDHSRQWSANWLEYHFGWSPLIGDMYSCAEVIQTGWPYDLRVKATAVDKLDYYHSGTAGGWDSETERFRGKVLCCIDARVSCQDPTAFTLNQLGIVNPASVAWELIPFSFLADWFGTFGTWIGGFTDFIGMSLDRPQYVYFLEGQGNRRLEWLGHWSTFQYMMTVTRRRTGSIPGPSVVVRPFRGLSPKRGLTAIALLLGIFAPRK